MNNNADLSENADRLHWITLDQLFANDPNRAEKFSFSAGDYFVDLSKNIIDQKSLVVLLNLAAKTGLEAKRDLMFAGYPVNSTEKRSVLHTALRSKQQSLVTPDGKEVMGEIRVVNKQMAIFAETIRKGNWLGFTGKPVRAIVNIGIGGSDLGPVMAYEALKAYSDRSLTFRFVSNIDVTHFYESVKDLNPETTLFIIASKTFTTDETMTNATTARNWLLESLHDQTAVSKHFIALSTNIPEVIKFGIDRKNIFAFWDFVGGRYSLPSAIGLSLMIAIGSRQFQELLDGYEVIDRHFLTEPLNRNVPVLMALINYWYIRYWEAHTHVILPYDQYLHRFPAYLQQLIMESNGKSVTLAGKQVSGHTASVIWGEPGTNSQHSFMQLLHQGTRFIPADIIIYKRPVHIIGQHHQKLVANALAQSRALAFGINAEELIKDGCDKKLVHYQVLPGNRPSTVIIGPKLTPNTLGQLIALYEHQVFAEGCLFDINSFDQFGVELGKKIAKQILAAMDNQDNSFRFDDSTNQLLKKIL